MSRHSFDPAIAEKVGINAAVIFQNIQWWCERNAVKQRNIRDDNAWTFNSITTFEDLFPYLSPKQIRTSLLKLENSGLLDVGNFNKDPRDRTKWYSLAKGSDPFIKLVMPHLPKREIGDLPFAPEGNSPFAPEGRPLPDSKPDINNTPKPPEGAGNLFSANETDQQTPPVDDLDAKAQEFWDEYPKCTRKANRKGVKDRFKAIVLGKYKKVDQASADRILAGLRGYKATKPDPQFIKAPLSWLNDARWEAFDAAPKDPNGPRSKFMQNSGGF